MVFFGGIKRRGESDFMTDVNIGNYIQDSWRQVEALDEVTGQFKDESFGVGEVIGFVFIVIVFIVGVLIVLLAIKRMATRK